VFFAISKLTNVLARQATVYLKEDKSIMLIALGNFGDNETDVTITFTDGQPRKIIARAIEEYQPAREFGNGWGSGAEVVVQGKGGWLLEVIV
jgi:hypothetical protein